MISLVSVFAISWLLLASLAEQVSLSLTWLKTPKTGFLVTWLISDFYDTCIIITSCTWVTNCEFMNLKKMS